MNWRDLARDYLERDAATPTQVHTAEEDAQEERAALAAIDGGLPIAWAASLAALEHETRPAGISAEDWRARLDAMWQRADEHGAAFVANGWTFEDVFGAGADWSRVEQRGAGWLVPGGRITAIDGNVLTFERNGARETYTRPQRLM
jgi:hypothetical protein